MAGREEFGVSRVLVQGVQSAVRCAPRTVHPNTAPVPHTKCRAPLHPTPVHPIPALLNLHLTTCPAYVYDSDISHI